jgi:hypothetical protein
MTSRIWGNRWNPSWAGTGGEVGSGVKGARRAFISTLDATPDLLTIEGGNEAKRSTVELRSLAADCPFRLELLHCITATLNPDAPRPGALL